MSELFKCGTCGIVTEDKGQICDVEAVAHKEDYCSQNESFEPICDDMQDQADYVCSSCGRPSDQASLLCSPQLS